MNTLPVPYVSQVLPGAEQHHNDCGAAMGLMLARAYNLLTTQTVDEFYNAVMPSGDVGLSAAVIQIYLKRFNLATEWKTLLDLPDLFQALSARKPCGVLVHYAPLVDAGFTEYAGFRGAHFMVATGIDIAGVAVHDPYRADGKGNAEIPLAVFSQAWTQATLDGNMACSAMIPTLPIQNLAVVVPAGTPYKTTVAVNVRNQAQEAGSIVIGILKAGVTITVDRTDTTNGRSHYSGYKTTPAAGWVWSAYLKAVIQ